MKHHPECRKPTLRDEMIFAEYQAYHAGKGQTYETEMPAMICHENCPTSDSSVKTNVDNPENRNAEVS